MTVAGENGRLFRCTRMCNMGMGKGTVCGFYGRKYEIWDGNLRLRFNDKQGACSVLLIVLSVVNNIRYFFPNMLFSP